MLVWTARVGRGRLTLAELKPLITIHFISSLFHRLLVHHLSASFNSLIFSSFHLLPPSFISWLSSSSLIYSQTSSSPPPEFLASLLLNGADLSPARACSESANCECCAAASKRTTTLEKHFLLSTF